MPPPTGPRAGTAVNTTRTTRSATNAARGGAVRGGGIRKRGAGGPARTDRDGDLVMDATPTGPRRGSSGHQPARGGRGGSARGARRGNATAAETKVRQHLGAHDADLASRISQQPLKKFQQLADKKVFKVKGLETSKAASNADRGEKVALEFLERKSANLGKTIKILRSRLEADMTLYVMVSQADAEEIVKLNNFTFAGAPLVITENVEGWPVYQGGSTKLSQEGMQHKTQLQGVLRDRYSPDAKVLNLAALGEDPVLIGMGYLEHKDRAEKTFKVLMTICDEAFPTPAAKRESVPSVTLANNNIDSVHQVYELAVTFPELKNLDLSSNKISNISNLNRWRGRLRNLETLLLNGNPIEADQTSGYQQELLEWFPRLQNLSGQQVRTPEQVAAAEAAKAAARPTPLPQGGSDFRDASGVASSFLTEFFPMYDADRAQAATKFYDNESRFSISVITHSHRNQLDGPVLPWGAYIKYSRNLSKVSNIPTRVQRLLKGAAVIKGLWATLPPTKHPDIKTEIQKYLVDCHPLPGLLDPTGQSANGVDGLVISAHGEYEEFDQPTGKTGKRSFTRTFVLGPAVPGSALPYRVVSDMLSLRAFTPLPEQPTQVPAAAADPKQQMIEELSRRTNMTAAYSEMCLAQVDWQFDNALAKFNETKPNLGPEAFITAA